MAGSFRAFHASFTDDAAWRTFAVPCGHDVMVDEPERLAEILTEVAQ